MIQRYDVTGFLDPKELKWCKSSDVEALEQNFVAAKRQMEDYAEMNKEMLSAIKQAVAVF
jgi:hypothetical protein